MGNDYYVTNEHLVSANGHSSASDEVFGYAEITRQYHDRYRLPVMHTETNVKEGPRGDEAVKWLWKEWSNVLRMRNSGVPMIGFTWYSLTTRSTGTLPCGRRMGLSIRSACMTWTVTSRRSGGVTGN